MAKMENTKWQKWKRKREMETEKSRHVPSSQWVISNTQQAIVKKSLDLQKKSA